MAAERHMSTRSPMDGRGGGGDAGGVCRKGVGQRHYTLVSLASHFIIRLPTPSRILMVVGASATVASCSEATVRANSVPYCMDPPRGDWTFEAGTDDTYSLFGFVYFFGDSTVNVVAVGTPSGQPAERMEYPASRYESSDSSIRLEFGPRPLSLEAVCESSDTLRLSFSIPGDSSTPEVGTGRLIRGGPMGGDRRP